MLNICGNLKPLHRLAAGQALKQSHQTLTHNFAYDRQSSHLTAHVQHITFVVSINGAAIRYFSSTPGPQELGMELRDNGSVETILSSTAEPNNPIGPPTPSPPSDSTRAPHDSLYDGVAFPVDDAMTSKEQIWEARFHKFGSDVNQRVRNIEKYDFVKTQAQRSFGNFHQSKEGARVFVEARNSTPYEATIRRAEIVLTRELNLLREKASAHRHKLQAYADSVSRELVLLNSQLKDVDGLRDYSMLQFTLDDTITALADREYNAMVRERIRKTIEERLREVFPNAVVATYGSSYTGLANLTSDIDMSVRGILPSTQEEGAVLYCRGEEPWDADWHAADTDADLDTLASSGVDGTGASKTVKRAQLLEHVQAVVENAAHQETFTGVPVPYAHEMKKLVDDFSYVGSTSHNRKRVLVQHLSHILSAQKNVSSSFLSPERIRVPLVMLNIALPRNVFAYDKDHLIYNAFLLLHAEKQRDAERMRHLFANGHGIELSVSTSTLRTMATANPAEPPLPVLLAQHSRAIVASLLGQASPSRPETPAQLRDMLRLAPAVVARVEELAATYKRTKERFQALQVVHDARLLRSQLSDSQEQIASQGLFSDPSTLSFTDVLPHITRDYHHKDLSLHSRERDFFCARTGPYAILQPNAPRYRQVQRYVVAEEEPDAAVAAAESNQAGDSSVSPPRQLPSLTTPLHESVAFRYRSAAQVRMDYTNCVDFLRAHLALRKTDVDVLTDYGRIAFIPADDSPEAPDSLSSESDYEAILSSMLDSALSLSPSTSPSLGDGSLACDLTINNTYGELNSKLLRAYFNLDPRVGPLVMMVKEWAISNGLHGAKDKRLSSYAYSLLVIFFLQQLPTPILPVLQRYSRVDDGDKYIANRQIVSFYNKNDLMGCGLDNPMSVFELFKGFMAFYHDWDWNNQVVSVRFGAPVSALFKQRFHWESARDNGDDEGRPLSRQRSPVHSMWLEDPVDVKHDLFRQCRPSFFARLHQCFGKTYTQLCALDDDMQLRQAPLQALLRGRANVLEHVGERLTEHAKAMCQGAACAQGEVCQCSPVKMQKHTTNNLEQSAPACENALASRAEQLYMGMALHTLAQLGSEAAMPTLLRWMPIPFSTGRDGLWEFADPRPLTDPESEEQVEVEEEPRLLEVYWTTEKSADLVKWQSTVEKIGRRYGRVLQTMHNASAGGEEEEDVACDLEEVETGMVLVERAMRKRHGARWDAMEEWKKDYLRKHYIQNDLNGVVPMPVHQNAFATASTPTQASTTSPVAPPQSVVPTNVAPQPSSAPVTGGDVENASASAPPQDPPSPATGVDSCDVEAAVPAPTDVEERLAATPASTQDDSNDATEADGECAHDSFTASPADVQRYNDPLSLLMPRAAPDFAATPVTPPRRPGSSRANAVFDESDGEDRTASAREARAFWKQADEAERRARAAEREDDDLSARMEHRHNFMPNTDRMQSAGYAPEQPSARSPPGSVKKSWRDSISKVLEHIVFGEKSNTLGSRRQPLEAVDPNALVKSKENVVLARGGVVFRKK